MDTNDKESLYNIACWDRMAGLYDLIYCDQLDMQFYLMEGKNSGGPVLEIGCGTGRVLLRLLANGIEAAGIDLSPHMLEVLKRKAAAMGLSPEVHVADMTDFDLGRTFALIIVPYRNFLELKNTAQRKKALGCFFRHLRKGGHLIIHGYNPSEGELAMTGRYHQLESEEMVSPEGKPYRLEWYLRYEPKGRVGHYKVVIALDGRKEEFEMDIHYVEVKKMRQLLSSSGFRNIKPYCGFDYSPYEEDCREVVWVAEK